MAPHQDFDALVEHIGRYPQIWVNPATFGAVTAYLSGYDHGRGGEPLAGLREWLIVRADGFNNFHWTGLAFRELAGTTDVSSPRNDHLALIAALSRLLQEFLVYRAAHGLNGVLCEYDEWLRRQDWYREQPLPAPVL